MAKDNPKTKLGTKPEFRSLVGGGTKVRVDVTDTVRDTKKSNSKG